MKRSAFGTMMLAATLAWGGEALAEPEPEVEAFARVVVADATLRSGPGVGHRVVYHAERGDVFAVAGREGTGFWLRVFLPDGRLAYILGDVVEPVAVDAGAPDAPTKPGVFAPPLLADARAGFALLGGVFDESGYAEVRPALVLAPAVALEPFAGVALTSGGRQFLYGGGGTLNIAPEYAVAPYVHLGAGALTTARNEDDFVGESESSSDTRALVRAGGGVLVSFRWRFVLRIEALHNVIFEPDTKLSAQTYAGGVGTYF
jgi:hypothetical protein